MQLFIDTANTELKVRNRCFNVSNKTTSRIIAPKRISSISVTANVLLNASAIKLAAINDIPIYFFHHTGKLLAQLSGPHYLKHSKLRWQQQQYFNSEKGTLWAIETIVLKIDLQIQTLSRLHKKQRGLKEKLEPFIKNIQELKLKVHNQNASTTSSNTLMALEGNVARQYYLALNCYLPSNYRFERRSRRPGKDYFNTTLNYIYGMTYGHITKALYAAGLDTFTGGLHTTPYKEALVYDCIEPFRPIMDRLLLKMCSEQILQDNHFKAVPNGYWLSKEGKKIIVPAYVDYLAQRIKFQEKVLSIENHIYHFARNLKLTIQENQI